MTSRPQPEEPPHRAGPIRVVVDTSVIRQTAGDLSRGDWPWLRAATRLDLFVLCLPNVVLLETVDHHRRDLRELADLERKAGKIRRRMPNSPIAPSSHSSIKLDEIDRLANSYRRDLVRWFESAGVVMADPAVSHGELVARALGRRRPFSEGEKGYRDALIWYSVLECAADGTVVFLTANTRDFTESRDGAAVLASDLRADLIARSLPENRVVIATSTRDLLDTLVPRRDASADISAWHAFICSSDGVSALDRLCDSRFGIPFGNPPEVPDALWSVSLRSISTVDQVDTGSALADGDGWLQIRARLLVAGRVGGFVWAWADPDSDLGGFATWDDWGGLVEYVAGEELSVEVTVAARFRPLNELERIDVVDVRLPTERGSDEKGAQLRARRGLRSLSAMLNRYLDDNGFLDDVLSERADEFEHFVAGVLHDWESAAPSVPGAYPSLAVDNLSTVLADQAGLRALERDAALAVEAIDQRVEHS